MLKTIVSSKGRILLPAALSKQDSIGPGDEFIVERIDRGEHRLMRRGPEPNEGVLDWLLACPEEGFLAPIASEPTDVL